MNDQNTDTVNTENTVIQMKKARATMTGAICALIKAQNTTILATRNRYTTGMNVLRGSRATKAA